MEDKSIMLCIRIRPSDRDEIRRLAQAAGVSQSEFVIQTILGRPGASHLERRLTELEGKLDRLPRGFVQ